MHGESRGRGYFCTMVRGPCKGALCDFWARAKLKKTSVQELVIQAQESIHECGKDNGGVSLDEALALFWKDFGVKSVETLSREEPALYQKIKQVEEEVLA